jgi:hypothetical protein
MPFLEAQAVSRATCRPRSPAWSADDTRASTAVMPEGEMETGSPITINLSAWYAGTGSFPDLNQRRAAEYETLAPVPTPSG